MFDNDSFRRRKSAALAKFLFFLAFVALAALVLGNVIMFLWNEVLAEATGVKPLNFWEALGLLLLSRILFGGLRFGGRKPPWAGSHSHRSHWREKWMQMSDEDRAAMREKWKARCEKK